MKFMSILLLEGRKEDLKKKYLDKFKEYPDTLDFVLGISDLIDFNHKYTDFVLKHLHPNSSTDEVEDLVELVKDFDRYSSQFPKKDINQYVSLNELKSVVEFVRNKKLTKELEGQVNKIYEDDKFLVVKPNTEESSCKYGSNTKWCVTSKGSGHFGRYTSGRQSLYFIINKAKSTNKNYSKVAIHFDDEGFMRYWDSQDSPMSQREIDVFEYAFPEMIESIKSNYKEHRGSRTDRFLIETFDSVGENSVEAKNYLNSNYNLTTYIRGFQNILDLGFGHSEARLSISLESDTENKLIDEYQVFITYKSKDDRTFSASIGFMGQDEVAGDDFEDLGLEGWGFDATYYLGKNPAYTAESIRTHIINRVLEHIKSNQKLLQKVAGTSKVWRANRASYGYTFSKNKGLVKKLINWLDSGKIGTKLDFLTDIGYLEKITQDGKTQFRKSKLGFLYNPRDLRGQHSSFFSSAKLAGILNYRKIGKDYFLIKGPNFEAFKSGELKAL